MTIQPSEPISLVDDLLDRHTADFSVCAVDGSTLSLADNPTGKLDAQQTLFLDMLQRGYYINGELPSFEIMHERYLPTLTKNYYDWALKNREFKKALAYVGLGRWVNEPFPNPEPKKKGPSSKSVSVQEPKCYVPESIKPGEEVPLLTSAQFSFINSMLDPHEAKRPREILKELGLTTKTYQAWLKDKTFRDYYHSRARSVMGEYLPDVKTALIKKANTGDINAIKLVFEMTGEWTDKPEKEFNPLWFVTQILDILQRQVRDPEMLENVAVELQHLLGKIDVKNPMIPTADLSSIYSKPPVGARSHEVVNGEVAEPPLQQRTLNSLEVSGG